MENRTGELLTSAFAEYQTTYMPSQNWAALTRRWYTDDITELLSYLESAGVSRGGELSSRQLHEYKAHLAGRGLKATSQQRKVVAVRVFLKFLYRFGYTNRDLSIDLIPPQIEPDEPRYLTEQEYNRLLAACRHQPRDAALVEILLQTGIRLAEIADLRLSDVELPRKITKEPENVGWLTVRHGKGNKRRTLPLNWKACLALKSYLRVRPPVITDHVFISRLRNGMSRRAVQAAIEKYLGQAGIHGALVHTLRHTFGTHQAARGTSLVSIQYALGHSNIKTTSIYLHTAKDVMRRELQEHAL